VGECTRHECQLVEEGPTEYGDVGSINLYMCRRCGVERLSPGMPDDEDAAGP
jgi:hypothetical protein